MANNNDKLNIYEVNSLLFQIISLMSEAERRKLQAVLITKLSDARNGKDLSSLITSISEAKRCELLERLTNWYQSKHMELREYPRETISIPVELSNNGYTVRCFTQNISFSGAFIQTDFSFYINQKINLTFSYPKIDKDLTLSSKVVRVESQGIGVKFDEILHDI
jgi:Tfp pilus assembly protein PilZ